MKRKLLSVKELAEELGISAVRGRKSVYIPDHSSPFNFDVVSPQELQVSIPE